MIDLNPQTPSSSSPPTSSVMLVAVVALLCVIAFAGGVFAMRIWENRTEGTQTPKTLDQTPDEEITLVSTEGELQVDWIDPSAQPSYPDDSRFVKSVCELIDSETGKPWSECEPAPSDETNWSYQLGTVNGGVYDGRFLIMTTVPFAGMGTNYSSFYALVDPQGQEQSVFLDYVRDVFSHGSGVSSISQKDWLHERLRGFTIDTTLQIPEFAFEEMYYDVDGNEYFFTGFSHRQYSKMGSLLVPTDTTIARTDGGVLMMHGPKMNENGERAFTPGENQLFEIDEDGRVLFYDLRPPFFDYEVDGNGEITSHSMGRPIVRWSDGTVTNEQTYFKGQIGGCGFTNVTKVVDQEVIDELGLVSAGEGYTQDSRYPVFEPSTYDQSYYNDAFTIVTWGDESDASGKTYADFNHPYFYYQDALGRWVEFMSNEIVPPVECGKPVIYLYPESTTDVRVEVAPRGGFSYTDPDYGDGWEVTAYPDGTLVNHADGLEYPYLFWEGRGGLYGPVETYWVVERAEVEVFLVSTLGQMRFNAQEIADFMEFWLPRMQEDPYYKIGFHGTNVMDQLAPLTLSVIPDNVFRVLMDYEGLAQWQPSNPPKRLPQANRDGFEVMEWGGVIR